jgi:transposase, IS5 family
MTPLTFRRLPKTHKLGDQLFAEVGRVLQASGAKLTSGTIVGATISGAPSWTKNEQNARDPEMHQPAKASNGTLEQGCISVWTVGAPLAHSTVLTPTNVHDRYRLSQLLHGHERRFYGEGPYANQNALRDTRHAGGNIDEVQRGKNSNKSNIQAQVEVVFALVNGL